MQRSTSYKNDSTNVVHENWAVQTISKKYYTAENRTFGHLTVNKANVVRGLIIFV